MATAKSVFALRSTTFAYAFACFVLAVAIDAEGGQSSPDKPTILLQGRIAVELNDRGMMQRQSTKPRRMTRREIRRNNDVRSRWRPVTNILTNGPMSFLRRQADHDDTGVPQEKITTTGEALLSQREIADRGEMQDSFKNTCVGQIDDDDPPLSLPQGSIGQPGLRALCLTGNIRTMPMKAVYRSFKRFATTNQMDMYVYMFTGTTETYNSQRFGGFPAHYFDNQTLTKFLDAFRLDFKEQIKTFEVHPDSTCSTAAARNVTLHQPCHDASVQFNWLDRCFAAIHRSSIQYNHVVRLRPDIALFNHVVLQSSYDKIIVAESVAHENPGRACPDWNYDVFFIVPISVLKVWWQSVTGLYKHGNGDVLPDKEWFAGPRRFLYSAEILPALIVRLAHQEPRLECGRIAKELQDECVKFCHNELE